MQSVRDSIMKNSISEIAHKISRYYIMVRGLNLKYANEPPARWQFFSLTLTFSTTSSRHDKFLSFRTVRMFENKYIN